MEETLEMQRAAWAFLSSAFNELPDKVLVRSMRENSKQDIEVGSVFPEGFDVPDDLTDDELLNMIGADRVRLLRYVDSDCIDPPYESIYMGQDENDVLYELHTLFIDAGFAPTGVYKEPADYIGMEIAFIEECCKREITALENGDVGEAGRLSSLRHIILDDHMVKWVPQYAQQMKDAARTSFYRTIAEILLSIFSVEENKAQL